MLLDFDYWLLEIIALLARSCNIVAFRFFRRIGPSHQRCLSWEGYGNTYGFAGPPRRNISTLCGASLARSVPLVSPVFLLHRSDQR